MFPRLALLTLGLVLAGTMTAAGAPGTCVSEPDKHETFVSPLNNKQYVYLVQGQLGSEASNTKVTSIGIWEETNGVDHLQTEDCRSTTGARLYSADRKVVGAPLP